MEEVFTWKRSQPNDSGLPEAITVYDLHAQVGPRQYQAQDLDEGDEKWEAYDNDGRFVGYEEKPVYQGTRDEVAAFIANSYSVDLSAAFLDAVGRE